MGQNDRGLNPEKVIDNYYCIKKHLLSGTTYEGHYVGYYAFIGSAYYTQRIYNMRNKVFGEMLEFHGNPELI